MPKKTVETTKVIEKTEKSSITICDGCGMDESDRTIDRFSCDKYDEDLYFCEVCMLDDEKDPINKHISLETDFIREYIRKSSDDIMSPEYVKFSERNGLPDDWAIITFGMVLSIFLVGGYYNGFTGSLVAALIAFAVLIPIGIVQNLLNKTNSKSE